jgi:hypothetical protein
LFGQAFNDHQKWVDHDGLQFVLFTAQWPHLRIKILLPSQSEQSVQVVEGNLKKGGNGAV